MTSEIMTALLDRMVKPGRSYYYFLVLLAAMVAWGMYAWMLQLHRGMIVTGLGDQIFWGVKFATFLFFVQVSLAGTFLSALMRVLGCSWQAPISRIAEIITVSALLVAGTMLVVNLGRPDRLWNVLYYGRLQSPFTWEVLVLTLYLIGSLIYLYLRLIPDLALCRDALEKSVSDYRHRLYSMLSLGWENTPAQRERLEKLVFLIAIVLIPVAASFQYVTTWLHASTFRPGWNSGVLAPAFVTNGLLLALAVVITMTTLFRRLLGFDRYIKSAELYCRLGWLLLVLIAVSTFFSFYELLPGAYKASGQEREFLTLLLTGQQSSPFWSSVIGSILVPALLVCWPKTKTEAGFTAAAVLTTIGLWISKSYLFVIATLQVPLMPFGGLGGYDPTWIEWSISLAGIGGFLLITALFCRFFPVIAISEMLEHPVGAARRS